MNRTRLECETHRVAHTGKLARSIVLDLCLLDVTGDEAYWRTAVARAAYVAGWLARDPEHGAFVYLPGRFDPRNCSNSVIDSGECTDALARVLLHPRAGALDAAEPTSSLPTAGPLSRDSRAAPLDAAHREAIWLAVERNAETYLRTTVAEKDITNQRLWGAMGLASAHRLQPNDGWKEALRRSVARSLAEQRADGSWGYEPEAIHARDGSFVGAADLTVYYHGRCLAFLTHILDAVPEVDPDGEAASALGRGLEFLAAVIAPEGLKPLALEGKRWFWDGTYEAGSNAYDVYALVRGAERFGRPEWAEVAARAWRQLAAHLEPDGGLRACREPGNADFVCRDFHTADLAWPAQVMEKLSPLTPGPSPTRGEGDEGGTPPLPPGERGPGGEGISATARHFADAGVLRFDAPAVVALIRTRKRPRNTLFGGAVGGALAYVGSPDGSGNRLRIEREAAVVEGNFTVYPACPLRRRALARAVRDNPPGREGRQWLFVARLLLAARRPGAAAARLWRGYVRPLVESVRTPATSHWALDAGVEHGDDWARIESTVAGPDGETAAWARAIRVRREYRATAGGLRVDELIERAGSGQTDGSRISRVAYLVPAEARDLAVHASHDVRRRRPGGRRLEMRPGAAGFSLGVTYVV